LFRSKSRWDDDPSRSTAPRVVTRARTTGRVSDIDARDGGDDARARRARRARAREDERARGVRANADGDADATRGRNDARATTRGGREGERGGDQGDRMRRGGRERGESHDQQRITGGTRELAPRLARAIQTRRRSRGSRTRARDDALDERRAEAND